MKFAITGAIEPMFGIIVCCTPMLQPVIAHLSGGRILLWAKKPSNETITSFSNIRTISSTGKSYGGGFERMDDKDEELGEMDGGKGKFMDWRGMENERRITVTRDFVVNRIPKEASGNGRTS